MKLLVIHAWLKGNLGDVLQLSVLLSALRDLNLSALDLAGYPPVAAPETREVLDLADRYLADPFPWYWHIAPAFLGKLVFEPWWRRQREAFFSRYDGVVCAPGPYLADYDPRVTSALADITIARAIGLPVVLSSHSIGPLTSKRLGAVAGATVRVAREVATYRYLCGRDIPAVLSADLAFLYPYGAIEPRAPLAAGYRVVFLRSNNLDVNALRLDKGALFEGNRLVAQASDDRLILATSDYRRDERLLVSAARNLGVEWVACQSVRELVNLIAGASAVDSDRYHPAICAAALGKPARVIANREPHKMQGLTDLLTGNTFEELQELARGGLGAVRDALQRQA
jgi:polysaccharide pyruvyl transferase WcaK-like protein